MTLAVAIASIVVFVCTIWLSGVAGAAAGAFQMIGEAWAVLCNRALRVEERRAALGRCVLRLAEGLGSALMRATITIAAALMPVWVAEASGMVSVETSHSILTRPDGIVLIMLLLSVGLHIGYRIWRTR